MYKVIIADDEELIRASLRMSVQWKALDCEIILEASDGLDVINYLDLGNPPPDIILLDIHMPGMNGLNLAEELTTRCIQSKIIIISAFQDFRYAKKALQLGVVDYLSKPIRNEELGRIISNTLELIDKEKEEVIKVRSLNKESATLNEYYSQTQDLVESELLSSYLKGSPIAENLKDLLPLFTEDKQHYATMVMKQICKPQFKGVNKRYIQSFLMKEPSFSQLKIKSIVIDENIASIIFFPPKYSENQIQIILDNICNKILDFISDWEYVHTYIGVSTRYQKLSDLNQSYQGALHMAENQFFSHKNEINFDKESSNLRSYKFSIIHDLDSFYQRLSSCIEKKNNMEMKTLISDFLDQVAEYSRNNIDIAKSLISEVCITVARLFLSMKDSGSEDLSINTIMRDIEGIHSLNEAKSYIYQLVGTLHPEEICHYSPAVQNSMAYIKQHFSDNISLDILSEHLTLNPSYLSRLLKKETGRNFSDIILQERLQASKNLLKESNLRLYEIADQVGYKDYAYFYQVFRKHEGITPMTYRKENRRI